MTITADGPRVGDVVLLKTEPDLFAVLDHHPAVGWNLIRIVERSKLRRYRTRHPGPSVPLQASLHTSGSSFVRETKEVPATEVDQFLAIEDSLLTDDLAAARRLVGKP